MTKLKKGMPAPDFKLQSTQKGEVTLKTYAGEWLVLYFYSKDNSSGCTSEAIDFTMLLDDFKAEGADILGISKDTLQKHEDFTLKHSLGINLASDPDKVTLQAYGVWVEKTSYGKKHMGVQRSTFLIDPNGIIQQVWPRVKVAGHAQAVLDALTAIKHPAK